MKKGLSNRGDSCVRQCEKAELLSVSLWQDNRPVVVVATSCDPSGSTTVQRRLRDGTQVTVPSPLSIRLYNKYMGGVNLNDQLRGYYSVRLKGRKYYKYIWWFAFD